jgi:hypothetical protein
MSKTPIRMAGVIGFGVVIALASAASAQDGRPESPQPGAQGRPSWGDPAQMKARTEQHRQQRMQTLHDALGLRPDQEGAWQAYVADSQAARGGDQHSRRGAGEGEQPSAPLTTPERLDRMNQRLSQLQTRMAQRAAAIRRFYGALDPRQQKTFDALFALAGQGGGRGRFGHGDGGPWRG